MSSEFRQVPAEPPDKLGSGGNDKLIWGKNKHLAFFFWFLSGLMMQATVYCALAHLGSDNRNRTEIRNIAKEVQMKCMNNTPEKKCITLATVCSLAPSGLGADNWRLVTEGVAESLGLAIVS